MNSNDYERSPWWWLWLLIAIVVSWTIVWFAGYGVYRYFTPCPTVKAERDGLADRWTVARHKYHGIHTSVYDPATGEAYFIRSGKRIRL